MVNGVTVSRHPLLLHKLGQLRSRDTPPALFRPLVRDLTQLLFTEASADLALEPCTIRTPLGECFSQRLCERIGLMPILRAGLGMVEPILELVPEACVWHLGLYRDHDTCQPVLYYNKLPAELKIDLSLVLDPMLATGGSAIAAVDILKKGGAKRLKFLGLIAAPEGVRALAQTHPDVPIHLGAIDSHLDENSYIVPGLGDAGDRQFGTHGEVRAVS
jgi:uracil phosphoribosyltransferase